MSTDTALTLGLLTLLTLPTLLGRRVPDRMQVFALAALVVDDLAALVMIAVAWAAC